MSSQVASTEQDENNSRTLFGFWIYIMTDCVLFATLFATFAVLRHNTDTGPDASELFSLPFVLTETLILLASSFTCGLAMLGAHAKRRGLTLGALAITLLLGLAFLGMELHEFSTLIHEGNDWTRSAFLSAFFTLVATHGLHITIGILWLLTLIPRIIRTGLTNNQTRRLALFSMFWHFLDVVWIFIFSFVYLIGAAGQ